MRLKRLFTAVDAHTVGEPARIIVGGAMIPTTATVAPTVPEAMPKMVAVRSTPR